MDETRSPDERGERPAKSYGNMGPEHWSRARAGANEEALAYYRERSRAAGVEAGGGARNHYCMACDGVIPFDHEGDACPHCGEAIQGGARRYFNWVELDRPPASDARPLLRAVGLVALGIAALLLALWLWLA